MNFIYVIIHLQSKKRRLLTLTTQNNGIEKISTLNQLIDNAIELPLGSQNLLLMMAKAMRHTRDCIEHKSADQSRKQEEEVS